MKARLVAAVSLVALPACNIVSGLGTQTPGSETSTGTASQQVDEAPREADWTGRWRSTFGVVEFAQTGRKVTGVYPGGTLTCDAPGLDLVCGWADNTGSGRAKFHWDNSDSASGTFGNGASDSDQGPWTLTWGVPSTGGDSGSSDSGSSSEWKSVRIKNSCSTDAYVCVELRGITQKTIIKKDSFSLYDMTGGGRVMSRSGRALNDGECGSTLATYDGSSEALVICK